MKSGRIAAFLALCLLVVLGVATYVLLGRAPGPGASTPVVLNPSVTSGRVIYFRHNGNDAHYGKLARIQLSADAAPEFIEALNCEVVHVAGPRGLCLAADRGVLTTYTARVFDSVDRRVLWEFPLAGIPSRCRVAADGRRAALTVFVSGHGYDSVDFSTQTLLINLETGEVEADLETFAVTRDGARFQSIDFNFWGVTFEPDSRHFYATLSSGGAHYLVRGDAERRTATVVRNGVECPSLSPDGRRIAFKKRATTTGPVHWHIAVLEMERGIETVLDERQSVDDQLEWLDDGRVLYSMPAGESGSSATTDVWMIATDGRGTPELLLSGAYSPAVQR
jgi:dipeptidyl aminopeptidase/acylaminoacyl peptidase